LDAGHELAMVLRECYWSVHRASDAVFGKHGVTANQFVLMSLLAESGGVTQKDLVDRASSDPNTIRQMLSVLEKKSLISRERHPVDGRAWQISLTGRGRRVYDKLWRDSSDLRQGFVAAVGDKEVAPLIRRLKALTKLS
jgi:DNA-binding MarR family transcriptional regulator